MLSAADFAERYRLAVKWTKVRQKGVHFPVSMPVLLSRKTWAEQGKGPNISFKENNL